MPRTVDTTFETTDMVLCIKYLVDGNCVFHKNKKYKRIAYHYSSVENESIKWIGFTIIDDFNNPTHFHKDSTFDIETISKHFVSLKDLRKQKLEKLNSL